jgi:acetolactate synthase small subunit
MIKQDFTLEIHSDNNFSVINRIVNILNRRRVRIKKLLAHEDAHDFHRGLAVLLVHSTDDMMEKVKHQLEKLIEVDQVLYHISSDQYCELAIKHNEVAA